MHTSIHADSPAHNVVTFWHVSTDFVNPSLMSEYVGKLNIRCMTLNVTLCVENISEIVPAALQQY